MLTFWYYRGMGSGSDGGQQGGRGSLIAGVEAAGWTRSIYLAAILTVSTDGIRSDHQIFIVHGI